MNMSDVTGTLEHILSAVNTFAPIAAKLGIPGVSSVAALINVGASIGHNALERINQGTIVAHSSDVDKIKAILADLQAANDKLNFAIAAS